MMPLPCSLPKMKINKSRSKVCSHGHCNAKSTDKDVTKVFFPKPCAIFHTPEVLANENAHVKSCDICRTCLNWVSLCKRDDCSFQKVSDIRFHHFICAKHFCGGVGPTVFHPDPHAANSQWTPNVCPCLKENEVVPSHTLEIKRQLPEILTNEKCEVDTENISVSTGMLKDEDILDGTNTVPFRLLNSTSDDKSKVITQMGEFDETILQGIKAENKLMSLATELIANNFTVQVVYNKLFVYSIDNYIATVTFKFDIDLNIEIAVYGNEINSKHKLWNTFPNKVHSVDSVPEKLKTFHDSWKICKAICEEQIVNEFKNSSDQFSAYYDNITSSIRSKNCDRLTDSDSNCINCRMVRRKITSKVWRRKKNAEKAYSRIPITRLNLDQAADIIREGSYQRKLLKRKYARLQSKVEKVKLLAMTQGIKWPISDNDED